MFEKIVRKHSVQMVIFFIWFFSVVISGLLTLLIKRITTNENYRNAITIACSAATVASLSTSVPTSLVYKKIIKMKDEIIKLSKIDGLTKLLNRTSFMELYEQLVKCSIEKQDSLAVIIFDLDHFKRINDSYGHAGGDKVLERVGTIIKQLLPEQELIGRFGGEEFIVVLHDVTKDESSVIGEKIRRELNSSIIYNEKEINFAVSVGIVHTSHCKLDTDSLIKIADDNLYIAKRNGRNNISIQYV
ncbi:GGDEF domain-containing protein [Vallitalea sp.]|jgi:diguanylate cyclase (GGDEF)-like protein|uniref:GGDEF domain-containing protein n=1 Tax=Vallitalea sp. TaxID=1882829 RepID=UPI0026011D93|nr:GGDEF domain-containing protein [Vallitalea sp.]MCT4686113.1 GGDEF domain-containing protein [Vallitalea sp.]